MLVGGQPERPRFPLTCMNKECSMRPSQAIVIHSVIFAAAFLLAGCTSTQLRRSTVAQSTTLADIYTQQVMNNLALFLQNPDALPFFAYPNQGTTAIQDMGNVGNPGYASSHFITAPFTLNGSRQATENWVLVPISDPAKLALMRCAYRQALSSCYGVAPPSDSFCPNCMKLRRDFYGPSGATATNRPNGELPCLNSDCWVCWGCKHRVPHDCESPYVGEYRGLYVWVPPAGRDMLTRLTLTILDYAVNDAKQFEKRTKSVDIYVNKDGSINYSNQGIKLTATIPIDVPSATIATLDHIGAYGQFLNQFGKAAADQMLTRAEKVAAYKKMTEEQKKTYWAHVNPNDPLWEPDLTAAVAFVKKNNILPWEIPSEDVLNGPAGFLRKGTASDGLQQYGQRLNAALAPGTATGP